MTELGLGEPWTTLIWVVAIVVFAGVCAAAVSWLSQQLESKPKPKRDSEPRV
ncbi:MAG: hypothetical protein O3A46_09625 [Candidatus Poribacteria bacterium]|nr:hypothetical protein [Candidatus Poribacteria bacterium]